MRKNQLTIDHSVLIHKPKEFVWDYTQNYDKRKEWDSSVIEATVVQTQPNRIVRLRMKGNISLTYVYKWDDRPNKTSLAAQEISSALIEKIGGSWVYEDQNGHTLWTQKGTIVFKSSFLLTMLLPFLTFIFRYTTRKAMLKAKRNMEKR